MDNNLDLDILIPQIKTVTVNKKTYNLNPIRLVDFLNIQRVLAKLVGKNNEEKIIILGEIFDTLKPIVPDLAEMNLTLEQALKLMAFIYNQGQSIQRENQSQSTQSAEKKILP